jgi:hypothetical protein
MILKKLNYFLLVVVIVAAPNSLAAQTSVGKDFLMTCQWLLSMRSLEAKKQFAESYRRQYRQTLEEQRSQDKQNGTPSLFFRLMEAQSRLISGRHFDQELPLDQFREMRDIRKKLAFDVDRLRFPFRTIFGAFRAEQIKKTLPTTPDGYKMRQHRQEFIRFLVENPTTHQQLIDAFQQVRNYFEPTYSTQEKNDQQWDRLMKMMRYDRRVKRSGLFAKAYAGCSWTLYCADLVANKVLFHELFYVAIGVVGATGVNKLIGFVGPFNQQIRKELQLFRPFIELATRVPQLLGNFDNPIANEATETFSKIEDKELNPDLSKLANWYRKNLGTRFGKLLSRYGINQPAIADQLVSIVDHIGFTAYALDKAHTRFKAIKDALYLHRILTIIGDIDELSAEAEVARQKITEGSFVFPLLKDPDESGEISIKITQGIHPNSGDSSTRLSIPMNISLSNQPGEIHVLLNTHANTEGGRETLQMLGAMYFQAMAGGPVSAKSMITTYIPRILVKWHRNGEPIAGQEAGERQLAEMDRILEIVKEGKPVLLIMDSVFTQPEKSIDERYIEAFIENIASYSNVIAFIGVSSLNMAQRLKDKGLGIDLLDDKNRGELAPLGERAPFDLYQAERDGRVNQEIFNRALQLNETMYSRVINRFKLRNHNVETDKPDPNLKVE